MRNEENKACQPAFKMMRKKFPNIHGSELLAFTLCVFIQFVFACLPIITQLQSENQTEGAHILAHDSDND